MTSFNIITWNVRGVGSQTKRTRILNHLTHLNADICLLQETHLTPLTYNTLRSQQYTQIFSAHYNSKQRGVAILIHKKIKFTHNTTISDPEGRFIIINISVNNNPVTIASIYGPNIDNPAFFHNFFSSLSSLSHCPVIIGGDFNTTIDPSIDKTYNPANKRPWQSTAVINQFMCDFGLGDGWRLQHPFKKQYSFYSPVHKSYSRIDFFLISNSIIKNILESHIHPILISDHAPVSILWRPDHPHKRSTRWRLNTSLLQDPEFDSFIRREWASFLDINNTPEISPSLLWETGKAVLRGHIISFSVNKKKRKKNGKLRLKRKFKD